MMSRHFCKACLVSNLRSVQWGRGVGATAFFCIGKSVCLITLMVFVWVATTYAEDDCSSLSFVPTNGRLEVVCPSDEIGIDCYGYHWHWVCAKTDKLYWDRRLETAVRMACDCDLPKGVVHAAPFVSDRPRGGPFTDNQTESE